MKKIFPMTLQLFAEGDGDGAGAETSVELVQVARVQTMNRCLLMAFLRRKAIRQNLTVVFRRQLIRR